MFSIAFGGIAILSVIILRWNIAKLRSSTI